MARPPESNVRATSNCVELLSAGHETAASRASAWLVEEPREIAWDRLTLRFGNLSSLASVKPVVDALLWANASKSAPRSTVSTFKNVTRYRGSEFRPLVDAFGARFAKMFNDARDKDGMASKGDIVPSCALAANEL